MPERLIRIGTLIFALAFSPILVAEEAVPIETIELTGGVHLLMGRGGNVAVSSGTDGVLVIDDQYASQYDVIHDAIAKLAPTSAKFIINTHWHSDHAGSNEKMTQSAAIIVAHENVRRRLSTDQVIEFFKAEVPASPNSALPVITFNDDITFHFNGDTIRVFHTANAHTDGDSVVHFENANVIHAGDTFFYHLYPFIDSGSGGSLTGLIAAANLILAMSNDETKIIPGHGALADKKGLLAYRDMLVAVHRAIADLIVAGSSAEQVVLAKPTAAFDEKWGGGFLKPDTFVNIVYDSIKRAMLK
ncbi:MAG: MBL fold metallo-hydrolase [Proteobacteria bacterium]|nr:MBL fold metallo-hydrolase [Pseudomonadota bacterium]